MDKEPTWSLKAFDLNSSDASKIVFSSFAEGSWRCICGCAFCFGARGPLLVSSSVGSSSEPDCASEASSSSSSKFSEVGRRWAQWSETSLSWEDLGTFGERWTSSMSSIARFLFITTRCPRVWRGSSRNAKTNTSAQGYFDTVLIIVHDIFVLVVVIVWVREYIIVPAILWWGDLLNLPVRSILGRDSCILE